MMRRVWRVVITPAIASPDDMNPRLSQYLPQGQRDSSHSLQVLYLPTERKLWNKATERKAREKSSSNILEIKLTASNKVQAAISEAVVQQLC